MGRVRSAGSRSLSGVIRSRARVHRSGRAFRTRARRGPVGSIRGRAECGAMAIVRQDHLVENLSGSNRKREKWGDAGRWEREHIEEIIDGVLVLFAITFFGAIRRAIGNLSYDNRKRRLSKREESQIGKNPTHRIVSDPLHNCFFLSWIPF